MNLNLDPEISDQFTPLNLMKRLRAEGLTMDAICHPVTLSPCIPVTLSPCRGGRKQERQSEIKSERRRERESARESERGPGARNPKPETPNPEFYTRNQ